MYLIELFRRPCLLLMVCLLASLLPAAGSLAADLYVDGGATYTVNSNISYGNEYVGYNGSGVINQSGFSNYVRGNYLNPFNYLILGYNPGSSGTYNLSGGSLSVLGFIRGAEFIGYHGVGTFNQSGGSNIAYSIGVGTISGATSTYNQSGGSVQTNFLGVGNGGVYNLSGGSISVYDDELWVGPGGTFNQSGGSIEVKYDVNIEDRGTYNLSAGSLQAIMLEVGGTFSQSGGSNQVGILEVGRENTGTYNLSGGSLSVGALTLGRTPWGPGTFNLSGGSLSASEEIIGQGGAGTFNQSGGSNQTITLILGPWGGTGTYNLSGGSLTVNDLALGYAGGVGVFNQSGGDNRSGRLFLGYDGSTGTYNLRGGSLTAGDIYLYHGSAFNFTGGVFNSTTLNNAGVVYAGPGCTMNVGGNFTQVAVGNLALGIASATDYGRISGGGTASLNGALTPVLLGGYRPLGGQVYSGVMTAAGGLNGTLTLADPWIGPTLYWRQRYSNTSLDLLVARDYTNPGLGLSANQAAVGAALNGLAGITSGDLGGVLNTIDSLSRGSEVAGAFQQISPDKAASLATLGFAGAGLFRRGLANRITNLRYRHLAGVGGSSSLGGFNLNYSQASGLMLAYNSSSLAGLVTAKKQAAPASPWGIYLDPALALGAQKSTVNQTGFNFTIAGCTAGADYRVKDDLLVGLATGYSHTGASFRGSGGAVENNTWPLTAYAAYLPGSIYAYGSLGYALNLFRLERNLSFGGLSRATTASPVGHQFNAYGEAGYDLKAGSLVLTPLVSLAYSKLWVNGFIESGGGSLNLHVDAQQADSLQTGVGARIAAPLKRNGVTVVPQAYATYQHEFSDTSRGLDARLSQGGGPFAFQSDNLGQDFALLGASVTLMSPKNFSLYLDYNTELGRENYTAHNLTAGLRFEF